MSRLSPVRSATNLRTLDTVLCAARRHDRRARDLSRNALRIGRALVFKP